MMGKTNTVFAEASETSELSLISETIITDSSDDIWKIEHVNNMFFVFLGNGNVMYGEDVTGLKFLKKDGENFHASYVIHKDGKYMFMCTKTSADKMFVSTDLNSFDAVVMAEKLRDDMSLGLFLNSRGEIVVLTAAPNVWRIGSFQSVDEINDDSRFNDIKLGSRMYISRYERSRMFNNRYIIEMSNSYCVVSTEGSFQYSAVLKKSAKSYQPSYYSGEVQIKGSHFFIIGQEIYTLEQSVTGYSIDIKIYQSLNGTQSTLIATLVNDTGNEFVDYITQCEDGIVIFSNERLGDTPDTFAFSGGKENLVDSFPGAITSEIPFDVIQCDCMVGEYTYLGCKGGIIHKILVDFSGNSNSPQISVLKTLSAKQALADSKNYTDKKYAELEARVAALEVSMED